MGECNATMRRDEAVLGPAPYGYTRDSPGADGERDWTRGELARLAPLMSGQLSSDESQGAVRQRSTMSRAAHLIRRGR